MLLKPLSILLLFSLLSANCSNLFVYLGFEANRNYISKELCINRDKPEMHCNGKCYLMKKLKQAQEKEEKQERQSQKVQIQDAVVFQKLVCTSPVKHLRPSRAAEIPFALPRHEAAIFHPPKEN
ncbi:hypothetical protein ABIE26_001764 [Pedobacter africanus]|uniref:Uncharacterized protein n=1 Tax=Pedobacter africanus TaxID=151894 RepID=A0ACC6KRH4_9SPHI|nr:hypothetical protein [Pedobacter africanus]MDR6781748.1 hypothetical protein [Pedobacter africanus]